MIIHSIKWRLQAWHGFLLVGLVTGLMVGFYTFEQRVRLQAVDNELQAALMPLLPRLAPPDTRGPGERGRRPPPREDDRPPRLGEDSPPRDRPPQDRPPENRERVVRSVDLGRIYYAAWSAQNERTAISTNAPGDIPIPSLGGRKGNSFLRTRDAYRELSHIGPSGTRVIIGTSIQPTLADLHKLAAALALIGFGIVVTGFAVGWWLATRALRPIAEISRTAQEIAAGDLTKRINASETESELGKLAAVLNSTFARLETAFAQQRQFTSDAAHELRTPVSVILTQVQSTLNKERSGPEYRETLEACQRAAQRMRRLTESLLEIARFDADQETLKRQPFDLAQVARDSAELIRPLAEQRGLKLICEAAPLSCTGDPERIAQVITNLLTNAIEYNRPGGEVRVTTQPEDGCATLTVADTGAGIAREDLPRLFERFYRADKSRTHTGGSAGLGLAICQAIVEAHHGRIEVKSEPGWGSAFTMRLPLPAAAPPARRNRQ